MQFKTAFAIFVSLTIGLNSCLATVVSVQINREKAAGIRADIHKLITDTRARHAGRVALREGEYDVLPSIEALLALLNVEALLELMQYESGCGADMWEYLRGEEFELVIDDFWGEPGILGILEFIATNGFEYIYDMVGLVHLLLGMKLPDLPYTEERLSAMKALQIPKQGAPRSGIRAEDECTPEDQEAIAEILSRAVPIWKMLDLILDLLATDESFVAIILRVREQDVIDSFHSFIAKDSAIALGERMEAIGIPPGLIIRLWNIFFGLYEKP